MSITRKQVIHLQCEACGMRDSFPVDKEEHIKSFEKLHQSCAELVQAMLKYLHIGPCAPVGFLPIIADLATLAKIKYQEYTSVEEIDYDKFYR